MSNELIVVLAQQLHENVEFQRAWHAGGGEDNIVLMNSMTDDLIARLGEGTELFEATKQAYDIGSEMYGVCGNSLVDTCRAWVRTAVDEEIDKICDVHC